MAIKWTNFKKRLPPASSHVMVEDHEGNRSCGVWVGRFIEVMDVPIGHLVKWSEVRLNILGDEWCAQVLYAHTLEGDIIDLSRIYDREDPCRY